MARFLVDMCVDVWIREWLLANGHDATHLRDEELQRLPNGEIFTKAAAEDRFVVTFDLDFGEIITLSAGQLLSTIVLRLRNTRTDHVIERLAAVLPNVLGFLASGAIVIIEEWRYRVRHIPFTWAMVNNAHSCIGHSG
jgi:predicted nuclease of predicted toxin-antitoxin system